MTTAIRSLSVAAATLSALLAGCGNNDPKSMTKTSPDAAPPTINIGQVGTLPAAAPRRPRDPRLVVPGTTLSVRGRHPLNSRIIFRVPVRNDGTRPLRIIKIDPG